MRIRSRLLLLVLAVLLPAVVGSAVGMAHLYAEEQEFRRTSLRETARALTLALDREMARREAVLDTLAASPALQVGDFERFYQFAQEVAAGRSAVILSDLEGRQILNTRRPFGTALPSMLPQERELRARYGNEATLVSDVYVPPAGLGPYSFAIQIPIRRDGRVVLFLTMASFTQQLQELLTQQRLPSGWHATIIDRKGVVAARSVDPDKYVGRPVPADLHARLMADEEGIHQGINMAGKPGFAFFNRSSSTQWSFLVALPEEALRGSGLRAVTLMAMISLVFLGLGSLAALTVGRRVTRAVEALRVSAQRLGRNEPVEERSLGTVEIDAVHHALAQASTQLRRANAELEQRVAAAVASYERSQQALVRAQKLEALGRLTGGIAHDFNNVLQTLTAGLQAAQRGAPKELAELLGRCQRAVARGTDLARQLMAFGRVQEVRAQTIDLAQRIGEARPLLQGALPSNIVFEIVFDPGLWPVTVDPSQLEMALLNLVMNSRDAMPAGGHIVLRASNYTLRAEGPELSAGDYVALALTDDGEGMSEDVMEQAMDPFYTTKGVGKGFGMGLPQAYGFARQSGGTLVLHSRLGQGTTATLYLPRASGTAARPRNVDGRLYSMSGKGKVLLVEDDELVRDTVSSALATAGFTIHTAETADDALRRIDGGERFDAVFTDVVMPGSLSGLDLAQHILQRHPRMGVVVATGYSDRQIKLPGVHTLPKPYELQQAVDAINEALAVNATAHSEK